MKYSPKVTRIRLSFHQNLCILYLKLSESALLPSTFIASIKAINRRQKQRNIGMVHGLSDKVLTFDSFFESGNLDMVVSGPKENEYDLYMRIDSNTKGHHQWFYFSACNKEPVTVKFNILNFTKRRSLYSQGMRISVFSEKKAEKAIKGEIPEFFAQWHKSGDNISYKISKLTQDLYQKGKIVYIINNIY
jgi:hypothetical protein